jgi:hypothetical protein
MYSIDSLKRGVEGCDKNIATFNRAIEKERETKADYLQIISKIEFEAKIKKDSTNVEHCGTHASVTENS